MKTVTLKIQRFDPEKDQRPHWAEYRVDVEDSDRLLDALHTIKWEQDGSLTFRRSCGHGVCGSDAMSVNGLNRLACKLLMGRLPNTITIMPLLAFRVIKDLVVDMGPFFAQYEKIKPYLINDEPPPLDSSGCRRQSSVCGTRKARNAFSVQLAPVLALLPGATRHGWDRQPLSMPIASSLIAVIRGPWNA